MCASTTARVRSVRAGSSDATSTFSRRELDIDEDRNGTELDDRSDGRREAGRHGDDLVAGPKAAIAPDGARQRSDREKVRARAGIHEAGGRDAIPRREVPLQRRVPATAGEPKLERRLDQVRQLGLVVDAAGVADRCPTRHELDVRLGPAPRDLADALEDLGLEAALVTWRARHAEVSPRYSSIWRAQRSRRTTGSPPARWARYHSAVAPMASARLHRARHPRRALDFSVERRRREASGRLAGSDRLNHDPRAPGPDEGIHDGGRRAALPRGAARSSRVRRRTRDLSFPRRAAARRAGGSHRGVRGRAATAGWPAGLRTGTGRPAPRARMASGTMRSVAQSPPPMTFPARAVATATPCAGAAPGEERASVGRRHALGGRLARGVGVTPAEGVVLSVPFARFAVL